uniref:Uncharacterized protein n=1 Tax=Timema shepardi TaxID=629360 RepID=A0A7R9FZQ4_TIMSH|nr:unnamed protein product [Timema shepardi]
MVRSQGQGLGTGLSQRMQQAAGQAAAHAAINELKDSFRIISTPSFGSIDNKAKPVARFSDANLVVKDELFCDGLSRLLFEEDDMKSIEMLEVLVIILVFLNCVSFFYNSIIFI